MSKRQKALPGGDYISITVDGVVSYYNLTPAEVPTFHGPWYTEWRVVPGQNALIDGIVNGRTPIDIDIVQIVPNRVIYVIYILEPPLSIE